MLPLKQDEEELLHLRPKEVGRWRLGLPAASFGLAVLGLLGLGFWTRQTAERSIDWEEISSDWEEIPGIDEIIHRAEGLPVWATKKVPRELSDLFYGSNPSEIPWARTECVIDVVQATSYLGQGVVFLYRAIKYDGWQCPDNSNVGCAISVSGFIASMFWLASYLSLASSACADSLNSNGLCGADWLALTADFAEVANAGAGIQEDCDFGKDWITLLNVTGDVPGWEAFVPAGLPPTEQAIKKIEHLRQAQRNRDFDITMCVFDSTNAASFLVRAILQIRRASIACSNPRNCAIDILDVISSFGWISRFVSMAVSDCMVRGSQKALCAADLSNLVAALSNGPASGMATVSDCAELQNPATELMHEPTA